MTQPEMPEQADSGEGLKEHLSTLLDVAGIVAMGVGSAWGLFPVVGPYAVAIGGVIVIGLNTVAGISRRPRAPEPVEPISPPPAPPPGPEHPGKLHVSGR